MHKSTWYCKAGFYHYPSDVCEHVVTQQIFPAKKVFDLPADFYSALRIAERKEANKAKYLPLRNRWEKKILSEVNEAREVGEF